MGKKLGLDDKYKILQGYKPAPRVRNIDPGMVSPGIGLFPKVSPKLGNIGPKGKISSIKKDLGIGTGIMGKIKNVLSKKSFQVPTAGAVGYEIGKAEKKPEGKMYGGKVMKASSGKDVSLKEVYALAKRNKTEDRLTEADIRNAKKVLGYKDALPEIKANSAKYGKFMKKGGMSMKDKKIKKVMGEFKKGELNIGKSKKKVKSKKQAIAIALASAKKKKA